jgi:RND family efflux transporter MFP subunit
MSEFRFNFGFLPIPGRVGALVLLAFLAGCHPKREPGLAVPLAVAPVEVVLVSDKEYLATEEVIGTVRAKLRTTIEAKISSRIERMAVRVGQRVQPGQLLVVLDAREIQARLDQAKAVREQVQQDRKRFATLLQQNAVTQQEFEVVESRARVAEAAVIEGETLLGYAQITAPFAGVVTRKLADVGDLAIPGRALLEVEDPSALRLDADIPEALIDRVRLNEKRTVRVASLTNEIEGVVSEIAPAADPSSRTFSVKLDLPELPGLRIGQFGRVAVPVSAVTTVRVPGRAVLVRGQMEIVFVVANQRAQMRLVKTGKRWGDEVEIVSGLDAGESVVTVDPVRLRDGQPVEVKR